ncbi:hypothetical protein COZ63_00295 [Candidatus Berkelbacteria bacterium CG_4_8_14_3_um_filter_42_13]|uniref:t-SNARE coiled-coil homology domain-containing protein n=1 Tax=Candidatus Berkelbacteria bacterium CG_4_8_14_3_um_filter_42_13 TaxID=1974505 RepID=A0A2M7K278_9BACT|nr:MAG: hypothetical protein COZ63_00295 [Candidatus Berkelbacteria bacterium CG_4_8_14_3_um_filter_42_13]
MKEKNEEKMTIDDLAKQMTSGFAETKKTTNDLTKSIDDLAIMVAGGFDNVQKKLNSHGRRFDAVDQRFDRIENEIKLARAEISHGLREIKDEIKRLDERVDGVMKTANQNINELVEKVAVCESNLSKLKQKIAKLKMANS